MPADQVIDLDELQRIDRGAAHPVPQGLTILRERLHRQTVQIEPRAPDSLEPAFLYHMNAQLAPPVEELREMSIGGARARPKGASRAVAREPVEREVPRIDGPHERLVRERGPRAMWREPSDRRVLADMPESVRPLAEVRRR